jgi:hypothetical protein
MLYLHGSIFYPASSNIVNYKKWRCRSELGDCCSTLS